MLKNKKALYFLVPFAVVVFVLPLFGMEYATDTYVLADKGFAHITNHMMNNNGRPIIAAFFALFDKMSASVEIFYCFSLVISIIFASLAIISMYRILHNNMSKLSAMFFAIIAVLTPFTMEYFMFIEKGFFMLAIYMAVLGCEGYICVLKGDYRGLILALPAILCSSLTYQIIPGAFAVLATLFATLYSKNFKKLVINLLIAVGIYGFGTGGSFLFLKLFSTSNRMSNGMNFKYMFNAIFFLGFKTVFLYAFILALIFFVCAMVNRNRCGQAFVKQTGKDFLNCSLIFIAGALALFLPFLFSEGSEVWFTIRILYPFGVVAVAIPMYFCYKLQYVNEEGCGELKKIGIAAMGIILALNFMFYHAMFISRQINDEKDAELAMIIGKEIASYEKENNTEIKFIQIYYDEEITRRNEGVLKIGDSNTRAFVANWSDVAHLNVILNRKFERAEPNQEVYKEYFEGKNWDSFSKEQLVFDGHILHICVY